MKIIDISSHDVITSWADIVTDGVSDVFIRLSLGYNTIDAKAVEFANNAHNAGLRVSYYHFAYPDKRTGSVIGDAKQEAGYFLSLFAQNKLPKPTWLAVDLEMWNEKKGEDTPLNPDEYLTWVNTFLAEVHIGSSTKCLIYSNKPYLEKNLPSNHGLGGIPLWISNWTLSDHPALPKGWADYFLWQYTDKGQVQGITSNCDLSRAR